MKLWSKLNLRWRVTILTAIVLTVCSIAFTAFSIYNARQTLYPILDNAVVSDPIEGDLGVGVPAVPAKEQKDLFNNKSVYFCIIMTVLGTTAVWIVAGRALSPVTKLNQKVRLIDEHNLSERLPKARTDDEIGQLTDSFNQLLSRLEAAFERQKRFTASAAHELKTPLATIKAGMQVLDRDENADLQDYKENAAMTVESVDRLTGVVNDLLMLASAEEGNQNMMEEISLDAMFDAVFFELSGLYEASEIAYSIDLQEKTIVGNADMLYRAFYNLIENAYKYNRKGGTITVKSFSKGEFDWIEISDTGVGISEEHQPLIFEAFYRVDASRSRKTAGAGLGLSLVKTIVERHGGNIQLKSMPSVGSTFQICIPK